ncbi:MAG: adenylate/guanylate cyclase domain-containing protein [bacterium]
MKSPVAIVGVSLTVILLVLGASQVRLVRDLAYSVYGILLRQNSEPLKSDQVAVIDIDEPSIRKFGQWPWPRFLLAEMTDKILGAGATVLAFDMVFAEPDRTSPARVKADMADHFGLNIAMDGLPGDLENYDRIFARALAHSNTILSCFMHDRPGRGNEKASDVDPGYRGYFYYKGQGDFRKFLLKAYGMTLSIPALSTAAGNNGFFNNYQDDDNVLRRTPLVWAYGANRIYPSLALEAARMHLGVAQAGIEYGEDGIKGIRLEDRFVPTDALGRLMINYRSVPRNKGIRLNTFPTYTAADLLAGRVPAEKLAGRVVLVGTSAPGLVDLRATPLTPNFVGVEVHATVIENILSGDYLHQPAWMWRFDMMATLLAGITVTWIVSRRRSWLSFILTGAMIVAVVAASVILFRVWHLIFIPTGLISVIFIIFPVLSTISYWKNEQHSRWLKRTFGAMVSDKVMSYIESNPKGDTLAGRKVEATILFIDIKGFTRISEELEPEKLTDLINLYFSRMAEIITRRDGFVDKFVGDMIMAEWGVPYFFPNHAEQACEASLEIIGALKDLQPALHERCGHDIQVRVGINTGTVTWGQMGSHDRYNYTVMGDAVNLASRLEPLNKEYGTTIIISEHTRAQAPKDLELRLLDRVVVYGKTQAVEVYELLGRKGGVPPDKQRVVTLYETAMRASWQKDIAAARIAIDDALRIDPNDGPGLRLKDKLSNAS